MVGAQPFQFYDKGKVTYERIEGKSSTKTLFKSDFTLTFNKSESSFDAVKSNDDHPFRVQNAKLFSENEDKIGIQLKFSGQNFIIMDPVKKIKWYYTNEFRLIEGYQCRRIDGLTADSLYVIAFYTDEIPVSTGPCLISGTPGLALGLVIPDYGIQYWAKDITFRSIKIPSPSSGKAKKITIDDFGKIIQNSSYNLGNLSIINIIHSIIY